jgi:hypothetical protein
MHWAWESENDDSGRKPEILAAMENAHVPVPCASSLDVWGDIHEICFIDDRHLKSCGLGCPGSACVHEFGEDALRKCARLRYEGVCDAKSSKRPEAGRDRGKAADQGDEVVIKSLDKKLREFWDDVVECKSLTDCMELDIIREGEDEMQSIAEAVLVCIALLKLQEKTAEWGDEKLRASLRASVQALRVVVCSQLQVCARAVKRCGDQSVEIRSEKEPRVCWLDFAPKSEEVAGDGEEELVPTLYLTPGVLDFRSKSVASDLAEVTCTRAESFMSAACVVKSTQPRRAWAANSWRTTQNNANVALAFKSVLRACMIETRKYCI